MIEYEPHPPVRAIVASFLFTDLVGFSTHSATEEYAAKEALSGCLRNNLAVLRGSDYWIKDTGDGALIAFVSNPEHALYMALAIAQEYGQAVDGSSAPSNALRTGLHLGTVKQTIDVEARPNFIGDGINATKRIMDFATPGQIAASRSFFEAVSHLDTAYAALFQRSGTLDDKHGRAHELYTVTPSAGVLQKLRLELAAGPPATGALHAVEAAAIGNKQNAARVTTTESRAQPNHAAEAVRNPFVVVFAIATLVVAIVLAAKWPAPAAPQPAIAAPADGKASPRAPAETPVPPRDLAAATPPSPVTLQSGEQIPVRSEQPVRDAAPRGATPPAIAVPASAPKAGIENKARYPAAPVVAAPEGSTPDRVNPRCTHILERAALGEPLTPEQSRELANSCR